MAGQLRADRERFAQAAGDWDGLARRFLQAQAKVASCQGRGSSFGALAQASGVPGLHDAFARTISEAMTQGAESAHGIAGALLNAARDFDATDQDVSQRHQRLGREIRR